MVEKLSQRLAFKNTRQDDVTIIIEPWATEFSIKSGSVVEVLISAGEDGHPYINIADDFLIIYLWRGCTCRLILDNIELQMPGLLVPHP